MRLAAISIIVLSFAASSIALAADTKAPVDPEEALDESLKGFGYLTGLARGCVIPEQRVKLEREALDLNAAIARLFGSDRAFMFATSFGYGTSVEIKVEECKDVLKRYESRVAKFRERGGATP